MCVCMLGGVSNGKSLNRKKAKFHAAGGVMVGIATELLRRTEVFLLLTGLHCK